MTVNAKRPLPVVAATLTLVFFATQSQGLVTADTSVGTPAADSSLSWGPVSHSLMMSISLRKSTLKVGEPIWVKVQIKTLGSPVAINRDGSAEQYQAEFVPTSPSGQRGHRLNGLRRPFDVWHTYTWIRSDDAYSEWVDFAQMYDVSVGSYVLTLESQIMPFDAAGASPHDKPITTLKSNSVQLTVVN